MGLVRKAVAVILVFIAAWTPNVRFNGVREMLICLCSCVLTGILWGVECGMESICLLALHLGMVLLRLLS